ncbi:MAG: hypothetical protein U0610_00230 [bacterium]
MSRSREWALAATLGWALAPAASAGDPLGDALVTKFASCFEAQGGTLTEDDRAVLAASSSDLARVASTAVDGVPCSGELPQGSAPPSVEACVAAVEALSCDGFAGDLTKANASLSALPPPPEWATAYAQALMGRTLDCYAAEAGSAPTPDQRAQLDGFGAELASGVGAATSGGACTIHTDALATCTEWLRGRACDALLGDLATLLGQGSSEGPTAASTTSADGIDVESADEAALDQRLAAAQAERQATSSQLIGPCAALIDCSTDLDATLDAQPAPETNAEP